MAENYKPPIVTPRMGWSADVALMLNLRQRQLEEVLEEMKNKPLKNTTGLYVYPVYRKSK